MTRVFEALRGGSGELVVRTRPPNLPVFVDGKKVGTSPLSVDVAAGKRRVEIGSEATETVRAEVEIQASQKTTMERTIPRRGVKTTAAFLTQPPAQIHVDGRDTGQLADGRPIQLDPGVKHRITLIDVARQKKREIFVEQGEGDAKTYVIDLDPRG